MGAVTSAVGGLFSGPQKVSAAAPAAVGKDLKQASKEYAQTFKDQTTGAVARQTAANSPAVISQLSQRALGQGPSLAEAQLKSATNRNLAQQLAAAASMRGRNPAATQRQLMMAQGDAGRQLAEQSAQARLQEQAQAAQQLAQQQALSDQLALGSAQQGFNAATLPGQLQFQSNMAASQAQSQANAANAANQNALTGALLGAGGTALGGWLGKAHGGRIPGQAVVAADSPANDTVPVMASPGEIVIPRSHATSLKKATSFVQTLMQKEKATKPQTAYKAPKDAKKSLASALVKKD